MVSLSVSHLNSTANSYILQVQKKKVTIFQQKTTVLAMKISENGEMVQRKDTLAIIRSEQKNIVIVLPRIKTSVIRYFQKMSLDNLLL